VTPRVRKLSPDSRSFGQLDPRPNWVAISAKSSVSQSAPAVGMWLRAASLVDVRTSPGGERALGDEGMPRDLSWTARREWSERPVARQVRRVVGATPSRRESARPTEDGCVAITRTRSFRVIGHKPRDIGPEISCGRPRVSARRRGSVRRGRRPRRGPVPTVRARARRRRPPRGARRGRGRAGSTRPSSPKCRTR
jgi:hypothetical protein